MSHSRLAAGACKAVYTSSILVGASQGTSANAEVPSSQRSTAPPAAPPAHLRERPYAWNALLRGLLCAGFMDRGLKGRARRRDRSHRRAEARKQVSARPTNRTDVMPVPTPHRAVVAELDG